MTIGATGTYTDALFPGTNYNSFEWRVTPRTDPSPDGFFWAHQFGFESGDGGYVGLQTIGSGIGGKCVVFSIAGAIDAVGPGIVTPDFDGGPGYSTRVAYEWAPNVVYPFSVVAGTTDVDGQWWDAFVTNPTTAITMHIASIKVPLSWGGLSYSFMWTERYSAPPATCDEIRQAIVDYTHVTANAGTVSPTSFHNHLSEPVACNNSQVFPISDGNRQIVGSGSTTTGVVQSKPALWELPVRIGVLDLPGGETMTELTGRTDARIQITRHGDITVQFKMRASDSQAASVQKLTVLRVVFTLGDGSVGLFDAKVRRRRRTIFSSKEEAGKGWEITGYATGLDYAKFQAQIYPPGGIYEPDGGVLSLHRKGHSPFGPTRTYGWPDPACTQFAEIGTPAVQLFQQANFLPFPYGKYGAPFGWLHGEAWWIWSEAIGGDLSHPIGDVYFERKFETSEPELKLLMDSAWDDSGEIWIDDQLIINRAKTPDAKAWTRLARTDFAVGPGLHTIRVRVSNEPVTEGGGEIAGNIGGFICAIYKKQGGDLILCTDSSWTCIGYPADIGMTVGEIVIDAMVTEPMNRGFDASEVPGYTFQTYEDSTGNPWPRIPKYPVTVGIKLHELLTQLAGAFVEWQWISGFENAGFDLEMITAEGTPTEGGGFAPNPSINYAAGLLQEGAEGNCVELTIDEDLTRLQSALLYLWKKGFAEYGVDSAGLPTQLAALEAWAGRHEAFLGIGDIDDNSTAFWTAVQNNDPASKPQPTVTATLSAGAGRFRADVPFIDYGMRHNIPVPDIDDPTGTTNWMRLTGVTISENIKDGVVEIVPVYATAFEIWQETVNRWLARSTLGLQNGNTSTGSTESPDVVSTEIIEPRYETFSGDVATVGLVGTPFRPTQTIVICQGLALSTVAGGGATTIALTLDSIVAPEQVVLPAGQKSGFSQWNMARLATTAQDVNVAVIGDGGHKHISVDVFYAPWPFT